MSMRPKSRRRLLLLFTVVFCICVVTGTFAILRIVHLRHVAQKGRLAGLEAIEQQDYPRALQQLGLYLSRNPEDVDVLLLYAKARENVEQPNGQHLGQAIALYQRALQLRPGTPQAREHLLELYPAVGFNTETIALADNILAEVKDVSADAHAQIVHALQSKVVAQMRMQRLDDAQLTMQKLTLLQPEDLEFRVLELQLLLQKSKPQAVFQYASQLASQHPDNPRFMLLKSIAASLCDDNKTATEIVRPLISRPQPDPGYTRLLIRQLDNLELFDDSFSMIEKLARGSGDKEVQRLWIYRLFETNRLPRLIDETSKLDPLSRGTDGELIALRVMALSLLNRDSDAKSAVQLMDQRAKSDVKASHWAAALHAVSLREISDPVKAIAVLRDTLSASPGNAIVELELGNAYARAGARDKAMTAWRASERSAPEWSAPLLKISQSLIAAGRRSEALSVASKAVARAPKDHDTQVALVVATAASLPAGDSAEVDKLLTAIANIQKQFPQDQNLVALQVNVLAQSGRNDAAKQLITSSLNDQVAPPEAVILSFVQTSRAFELNKEEECFAVGERLHGLTPDLAYTHAVWLQDHDRGPDGLALLLRGMASHSRDDVSWKAAWAQFLDQANDPRAKAEWIALGDANPADVRLQWSAVSARSVQSDHEFLGRTIDRLVSLLGDDSLSLRLLRARWYLRGNSTENDASQAAILLGEVSRSAPDMLAPRLLLASCYMKLGNVTGAIDELAAASDAQPDFALLAVEVARLLQSHGEFSRSRQYIDRAAHGKRTSLLAVRQAASLLAMQGDYAAALSLLESAYRNQKQPAADIVLAALYRQLNQPVRTAEICAELLKKPDGASVSFAADFYASQGDAAKAKSALALLEGLSLPSGVKNSILARYAARYGNPDEALNYFQSAAAQAPQDLSVWQQLISYCFSIGNVKQALTNVEQAAHSLRDISGFDAIRQNSDLLMQSSNASGVRPLLMSLGSDPAVNGPVIEAIRTLVSANTQNQSPSRTVITLRQLADRNPRILALQTTTLDFYILAGQTDDAVQMASRTVQAFPAAIEPLRVETGLLEATHRFDQAIWTAKEWKLRDPTEALEADLAIAGSELNLGDPSSANKQIEPYLSAAVNDPDKFTGVLLLRARGLLEVHQPDQAQALLLPLLPGSAKVRGLWISLATDGLIDHAMSVAWLQKVTPLIAEKSDEQVTLANAWLSIGYRAGDLQSQQVGKQLLAALVEPKTASIQALVSWGSYCEITNDDANAIEAYRRAILCQGSDPATAKFRSIAFNNLASVLVKTNGNLEEAQRDVDQAIELRPTQSNFLDTRAMVQAARKDITGATTSLRTAQQLEPHNLEWRVNLLALLTDSGQIPAAKAEQKQIDASLTTFTNTPPGVRQKYDQICTKLR